MASSKVSLKLLIDLKQQRVLFAEANKDCVDFLFSLLTLPIGAVMRLLDDKKTNGGLTNLYRSVSNLNNDYICCNQQKDVLLKPKVSLPFVSHIVPLLPIEEWSVAPPKAPTPTPGVTYYKCGSCKSNHSYLRQGSCLNCSSPLSTVYNSYVLQTAEEGFVKGLVTYMVMDDLGVFPMSNISTLTLLNKFNVKDLGSLEEKVVQIGMDEGLELLKHSLSSNTVLTDVFLGEAA
ncbi:uncharacterized protein [Rutidosis leptorrhynchoides]|uniref:uncharacterized protein n=1 Tax=Rutidosis leptorrhynchoides TaxID=125765 RepID=UPI003A9940B3